MVDGNQILNKLSRDIYLLAIFHQNICGLSDELTSFMFPNVQISYVSPNIGSYEHR